MDAVKFIVKNSEVKITQISDQVHIQPKSSLKKKKRKKG